MTSWAELTKLPAKVAFPGASRHFGLELLYTPIHASPFSVFVVPVTSKVMI